MMAKEWFHGLTTELSRNQRRQIRSWVFIAAAALGVLALSFFAGRATAAEVFKAENEQGPVVLRLSKEPCTDKKMLDVLYERILDDRRFKAAVLTYGGKDWKSCWVEVDGAVLSIDEEGAPFQPVPRQMFREEGI
jgi:hypothetical protein